MSDRSLYLEAAEDLRPNERQWQAYESTGHCVLLAGPGSGKTKTLTVKLARMLAEDVEDPRGIACITYSNECARELEMRLDALGVSPSRRVFIGTVHSFSLTRILLPYAKVAGVGLPDDFSVATKAQCGRALERAFRATIGGPENPQNWDLRMSRHRRRFPNRNVREWHTADPELTGLAEAYEANLRAGGLIDFDDMPLFGLRALAGNEWLQKAIVARYPILAVDEYQDLGQALHRMVMGLCFGAGMRLFAVGDVDQSIYGFTGAHPEMLRQLSERDDVETVRLNLNYRCGSDIVSASEYALGEERGYRAPDGAHRGTIYFEPHAGNYAAQARHVVHRMIPAILERSPDLRLGEIAILYPAKFLGDDLASSAEEAGYPYVRTDGNALYPRSSRLMRWLELCAMWSCGGWKSGEPRFSRILSEGARIFHETLADEAERLTFQRDLIRTLWDSRDGELGLREWLLDVRAKVIGSRTAGTRALHDELEVLDTFVHRLGPEGDIEGMQLGQFSGIGAGLDRLNLSSLHSAKGREFDVVILFGVDSNRIPNSKATQAEAFEARRLFYVGFTRARHEVHMVYDTSRPSPFVVEVGNRLAEAGEL